MIWFTRLSGLHIGCAVKSDYWGLPSEVTEGVEVYGAAVSRAEIAT